jgi:hypothetical protein
MTALARASSNCKRQTPSLVRDSAPHEKTECNINLVVSPRWVLLSPPVQRSLCQKFKKGGLSGERRSSSSSEPKNINILEADPILFFKFSNT